MAANTALAIASGYTRAVYATSTLHSLELLVQPDDDLGERFRGWDAADGGWMWVNGWMFTIEDMTDDDHELRAVLRQLDGVDLELRAAA